MESVSVQLGVQFGSVPTDTVDVLLPDPTYSNPPAADQVRSILYEASQLLSCYPRAALALLSGRQKQYLGRPSADSTIEYRAGREAVRGLHSGAGRLRGQEAPASESLLGQPLVEVVREQPWQGARGRHDRQSQ